MINKEELLRAFEEHYEYIKRMATRPDLTEEQRMNLANQAFACVKNIVELEDNTEDDER